MAAREGMGGWRALLLFWVCILLLAAGGIGWLAWLGAPPAPPAALTAAPAKPAAMAADLPPPALPTAPSAGAGDGRPRIAVLVDGVGLSAAGTQAAIALPGAVGLAVSPYAAQPAALRGPITAAGHEILVSIPMEPTGFPLTDPGPLALLTAAPPAENLHRLRTVLDALPGAVGATNGLDGERGERFAASPRLMAPVLAALAARHLYFIDARPDATEPAGKQVRSIDLVLDSQPDEAGITAQLARLEAIARRRGAALGLAGPPLPALMRVLGAALPRLAADGFDLVPPSALVAKAAIMLSAHAVKAHP